jgi:protein TonB
MFEDSLMESGGKIKTKSKYWSIVTLCINGVILAALIIWPLLHPEALPTQMMATLLVAPPKIPKDIKQIKESAAPPAMAGVSGMEGMGGGTPGGVMGGILGGVGSGPVVKAAPPKKLSISSGVMAGNLLDKVTPQYPAIAKAARIQGTVVLQATISKTGSIENLRVVSGPPMLQQSAMDAVRSWRYKPYLLNGDPVEVETTVNVVFNLGG